MPKEADKFKVNSKKDQVKAVNHPNLLRRSETFQDDKLMRVDRRCFGLLAGPTEETSGIKLVLTINAFDDPSIK